MRYPRLFLLTLLFLQVLQLPAQYYETGEDPASVDWLQINTGRFRVIYPESFGNKGIDFAKSLEESYSKLTTLFPEEDFRIPVIIHNHTIWSNGYVAWAPRRIEIYPTPGQNTIPLDPYEYLSLHELTHVFQMLSLNRGFSRLFSYILGEQFTGIVASLLPLWLLEGEAVFAESFLSESGRGRSPSFQKEIKALSVEKDKMYRYDKILNGSYRDYIPNYYQTGYQMVTWPMVDNNPRIWAGVRDYTARNPFTLNPVNISLSRSVSHTKKSLYNATFDTLKTIWISDDAISYEILNPVKKGKYINYHSPVIAGSDSIAAIRSSLSDPVSFVLINNLNGKEKRIYTPGYMPAYHLSSGGGKIVWVEERPDPRWRNRNYTVIMMMDIKTGKRSRLTSRSRYMAASLSPDGKRIAAVESSVANINTLVIIDAAGGDIIQTAPAPGNASLQRPAWDEDGSEVILISLTDKGEGIISYSPEYGEWKSLLDPGRDDLQSAFSRNDSLFYISSRSGTDNIYIMTPGSKSALLTKSRFGTTDLSPDGKNILFCDYTSSGNNICITTTDKISGMYERPDSSFFMIDNINNNTERPVINTGIQYMPEPYRKWQHLFRFHSWMPFYADIEEIKSDPASIRPGFSVMTQNHLSTLISSTGYEYSEEGRHLFHSRITWKGWYPVLETHLDYGDMPFISKLGEDVGDPAEIRPGMTFYNYLSLPLRFSSGSFSQYLHPVISSRYTNYYIYDKEGDIYDHGQTILSGRIYFSNYYRQSSRDIYPGWGQVIDLQYSSPPFDKDLFPTSLSLKSLFFVPGIFPDNVIRLRFEKEKQNVSKFLYGNRVSFPRGYKNIISRDLNFLSADYILPLLYPDLVIPGILYLKRIRADLFYDFGKGRGNTYYVKRASGLVPSAYHDYAESFRSSGFELIADFHLLRIPFMISGGLRSSWTKDSGRPELDLLFNINIYGMILGRNGI